MIRKFLLVKDGALSNPLIDSRNYLINILQKLDYTRDKHEDLYFRINYLPKDSYIGTKSVLDELYSLIRNKDDALTITSIEDFINYLTRRFNLTRLVRNQKPAIMAKIRESSYDGKALTLILEEISNYIYGPDGKKKRKKTKKTL